MGLFKSKEEKAANQEERDKALLEEYGLAFDGYTDEDLASIKAWGIKRVNSRMAGTGLYEFGNLLPGGNSDAAMQMTLQKAQIEQQWVIVRQNEEIIRLLRTIAEK